MIEGIDSILGTKLENLSLSIWANDSAEPEVEMAAFDFGAHKLILGIDVDNDEIIIDVVKEMPVPNTVNEIIDINSLKEHFLLEAIGKKIIWIWVFENNQGYHDGIQIEFENRFTIQFMVEASFFSLRTIKKMKLHADINR